MRRTLTYCKWKATWWRNQPSLRTPILTNNPNLLEGLGAYAAKEAALEDSISVAWAAKWKGARERARPIIDRVLGDGWDVDEEGQPSGVSVQEVGTITVEIDNDDDGGDDPREFSDDE